MSVHRIQLDIEVDDVRHAKRNGRGYGPPRDVRMWNTSDLELAFETGVVDPGKCVITYKGRVARHGLDAVPEGGHGS